MSRIFDTYDIVCYKKTWAQETDIKDVNIFSGVNPTTVEAIDMKDYMMDMSELSYDFDEAEKENGENQLFYVSSDITFKLSGIENNDYLKTFFGLYTNTDYIKWHVKLSVAGVTIWEGLINHESIELKQSPDDDSDIISVTALSFEKEFKAYYQATPLPSKNDFFALSNSVGGFGGTTSGHRVKSIDQALEYLFPNITWSEPEGNIYEWKIISDPILHIKDSPYGTSDNYVFVKSSYERIATNGENRYDFLRRLCNSMGWVFYYYQGGFIIKNRSTDIPTITTLDCDEILDRTISKYKETTTFDHILLLDGSIDGGDNTGGNTGGGSFGAYQMRGERLQLISDYNNPMVTNGMWWNAINGTFLNDINAGERVFRYHSETNDVFNLAVHTKTDNDNPKWNWYTYGINKENLLRIDIGDTGNEMWLYDVTNGYNSAHTADALDPDPINQWTANRVRFKGNYGNCLVKTSYNFLGSLITYTYQDYVKTNLFTDNWLKFFTANTTRKISIKYNDVITNPIQVFQFTNDTERNYDGTWIINNMKINVLEETTTLELQKKVEESDRI